MKFIGNLFGKDLYIPNDEIIILKDSMGTGKTSILNKYELYLKDNFISYVYLKEKKIKEMPASLLQKIITCEKYADKFNTLSILLTLCDFNLNKYLSKNKHEIYNSLNKAVLFVLLFYLDNSKVLLIDCDGYYTNDLYYLINYIKPLLKDEDKQIILSTIELKAQLSIDFNLYTCNMLLK